MNRIPDSLGNTPTPQPLPVPEKAGSFQGKQTTKLFKENVKENLKPSSHPAQKSKPGSRISHAPGSHTLSPAQDIITKSPGSHTPPDLSKLNSKADSFGKKMPQGLRTSGNTTFHITALASEIMQNPTSIDNTKVTKFATDLKNAAEAHTNKASEQQFVETVMRDIVGMTKLQATSIIQSNTLSEPEKVQQLKNLVYTSQSLLALASVQHRFGRRLAFHCLPHSLGVATGAADFYKNTSFEMAAFCAGANHDTVMAYTPPQNTPEKVRQDLAAATKQASSSQEPVHVAIQNQSALRPFKNQTEQQRAAGFNTGNSERDSYEQMEAQLSKLMNTLKEIQGSGPLLMQVETQLGSEKSFRKAAIRGTIPVKDHFAPPMQGDKFKSIGNVNVVPTPVELTSMEAHTRTRMLGIMDRAAKLLQEEENPRTYSQAVQDIEQARNYYADNATGQEPKPRIPMPDFLLSKKGFLLDKMPPFDEPGRKFSQRPVEEIAKAYQQALLEDMKENGPEILTYLTKKALEMGTGVADLGALMLANADEEWAKHETIALIMEEQSHEAEKFFKFYDQTFAPIKDEAERRALFQSLQKSEFDKGDKIDPGYQDFVNFLSIAYFFVNDQKPFAQGRIDIVQSYVYGPMKGLQNVLNEQRPASKDAKLINQLVENFESKFCVDGNLRTTALNGLDTYIELWKDPERLCQDLVDASKERCDVSKAGYTKDGKLDRTFIQEQSQPLISNRIWN